MRKPCDRGTCPNCGGRIQREPNGNWKPGARFGKAITAFVLVVAAFGIALTIHDTMAGWSHKSDAVREAYWKGYNDCARNAPVPSNGNGGE